MIFLRLFFTFLKIGAFTFGGGYAMVPLISEEVVSKGWLSERELIDFIAVSEATPGPFAVNAATFVGIKTGGFIGGICATLGVILPSFIIILIVSRCYQKYRESKIVKGVMTGLRPCVVGLIAYSAHSIGITLFSSLGRGASYITNGEFWIISGLFLLCLILSVKKTSPIIVICLAALVGVFAGYMLNI